MSDDSFIREVNEELRQDQMKALGRRYGPIAIGIAVLAVLGTAAWVAYDYWSTSRANASGDRFAQALELSEEGNNQEALEVLQDLEETGAGAYPMLARLRAATALADSGDVEGAIAGFDAVANDGSAPAAIRDMARLRAALLLVDHGSYADVAARVEALTADGNPMRHLAREALALAAWKEGDRENALALFGQIADDEQAPQGARQRAEMMSDLIAGSGSGQSG
ncbi:tetratricopeptide repeat protein [Chelativorans sp. AA-79]|uniref:tetratricopeptide repeat protein n=1 Tax=Chelativorans sp. AA-79 TaxID=3028735 RepID=UPI0023F7E365|nr:tetratricopeptide repeat protein [Chelativorans sp. AA-79]WEX08131.1 tetratricopeptide repeat protein [Chelativorans sp. AA-79]